VIHADRRRDPADEKRVVRSVAMSCSVVDVEAYELQDVWFERALQRARIDRENWHPARGVDKNSKTVQAVYGYYGQLFLEHPYLEWAGMAGMIGPAFYAGFLDLGLVPDAVRGVVLAVRGRASRGLARDAAGDLGYYETKFLTMQKKIFEDQATMHEAYLDGGIATIREFYDAGIIDSATLKAWQQIDTGHRVAATDAAAATADVAAATVGATDPHAAATRAAANAAISDVVDGNRALLFREQHDIIDRYYVRMLAHRWPIGPAFTYLLTLIGAPSVPNALSYPQRYPLRVDSRLPQLAISTHTPLADGNIAIFADRWKLIEADTLPAYLAVLRNEPEQAYCILHKSLKERANSYRLRERAGQLVLGALTHWELKLRAAPSWQLMPSVRAARRPLQASATVIDLTSAPSRQSADFPVGADSRIWMNPRRTPFDLKVALPQGRDYHARAELAVMLSSASGGNPDRLTVQLPPASLEATAGLIGDYAREWGFLPDTVAAWRAEAARRESGDRYYGTHVFRAASIGAVPPYAVHLEFQVAHHVAHRAGERERECVVTALFSWS
jgi:hypothetical protein